MKLKLDFLQKYAKIGSWTENHDASGNATDKRVFYTSFTGGSGNNQYPRASLVSAFSATSGLSEKGRKREKKDTRMKHENTAKSANNSQYIDLNQPIQQVLFEFYKWQMRMVASGAGKDIFPTEESIQNWYCLETYLRNVLVDFKPKTQSDERIKLSILVDEIESQAMDNNYVVQMNAITGNELTAHTIARQLLQR